MKLVYYFFILFLLVHFISCSDSESNNMCEDEKEIHQSIVNGTESFDPSVVKLTEAQTLAIGYLLSYTGYCTATLISDKIVLTAAHCIRNGTSMEDIEASKFVFAVGNDLDVPDYVFEVEEVHSYPYYVFLNKGSDIGIVILKEYASDVLGDKIIPIPINNEELPSSFYGSQVQVVGYGVTYKQGETNARWWAVEDVTSNSRYVIYLGFFVIHGNGTSICYGDSGGPVLWTFPDGLVKVAGVNSGVPSTNSNCDEGTSYETSVFSNYEWIKQYIDQFDPCKGLSYYGECINNTARWCEKGEIREVSCSESCIQINGTYRCNDPCNGVTYQGYCDGNTAIWCLDDLLHGEECRTGSTCSKNDEGNYRCVIQEDPCHGVSTQGYCAENKAVWCENNQLSNVNCEDLQQVCTQNSDGNYRCIPVEEDPCNGVDYRGYCDGDKAVWCDMNYLSEIYCPDYDYVCDINQYGNYRCLSQEDICQGVTYQGYCEGDNAVWCEMNDLANINCSDYGLTCMQNEDGNYRCLTDEEIQCIEITKTGRCDDNTAVWCENYQIQQQDCTQNNQTCGELEDGNFRCYTYENNNCGEITYQGICTEDNKVQWCENGQIKERDCSACDNLSCRWVDDTVGNYCIE